MHPVIAYLAKMLVCSAVLLGYYWLALRNERFHQWNRFYLLSAFFLSVVVPLVNIPLLMEDEPTAVVTMLAALPWNQSIVVQPAAASFGWKEACITAALLMSVAMLLHLIRSVWRVVQLYQCSTPTSFRDVSVIITQEQTAPFSFFRWLFWRQDIDPDSENGQRMLQHELTHISEKHSADKLVTELLLIVFWMNPFFWLMRRELYAIHEFLADQKAIARYDGAAFAAMILQAAHPMPTPALSNPFFTSHLKRRLVMITTSHEPKYSYIRRISGLGLMLATTFVLALSIDHAMAQKTPPPPAPAAPAASSAKQWKDMPDSIRSAEVIDKKGVCYINYTMKDGRRVLIEMNKAKEKGYFIPEAPPPPPPAPKAPPAPAAKPSSVQPAAPVSPASPADPASNATNAPAYYYDGILVSEEIIRGIDPAAIASVNVWKGEKAIQRFGDHASNGAVEILSKQSAAVPTTLSYPADPNATKVKSTMATLSESLGSGGQKPLILLNDKEISEEQMKNLKPQNIMEIKILKGADATKKYGSKGIGGVILIYEGC